MRIRLMSPALARRYGEEADIPDAQAQAYINAGVAISLVKKEKKSKATSAKKEKAETTSK